MATRLVATRLVACLILISAAAVVFLVSFNPCTYSLPRVLLTVTGLDPYMVSCARTAPLSAGKNIGGPIVTDIHACTKRDPPSPSSTLPPLSCCPPQSASEPINFTLPNPSEPLRVRRPVHAVGAEYIAKYERAIGLMKALPDTDPRSLYQMANIHCAYCTTSYRQAGNPELGVEIHYSWLFFPFHRAYLYFIERIAAKLIGEPGFAIPFWSWDVPEGMQMPREFITNPSSPLYDPVRNPRHAPPAVVDLEFIRGNAENNFTANQQIQQNLRVMYKAMISNAVLPSLFHGQPFRAGQVDRPGAGTVELWPHNSLHGWTGDIVGNGENMGVYYSAGRDPLFFPHHSNIDRMWDAWRSIGTGNRAHVDFTDPDWLDSSFLFYDEESRLVRITVRDVLDIDKLRYKYDGVGMAWADARPPITPNVNNKKGLLKSARFPVSLDDVAVTAEVRRPRVSRSREEKDVQEEVLVVEGIETDGTNFVKFDVYVNAMEYEKVEPGGREMAQSFVCLSHPSMDGTGEGMLIKTSMRVPLNGLLEDLGVDGQETVTVTLVPRHGKVKIQGLRIVYMVE